MKLLLTIVAIAFSFAGIAQQKISGRVTSTTNEPLGDVSIKVKGSNAGTTTDSDGNFSLVLPRNRETLIFSSIGYQTKEVVVGAQAIIEVQLVSSTDAMDDIVVVGYGRQRKSDVTGAVASIYDTIAAGSFEQKGALNKSCRHMKSCFLLARAPQYRKTHDQSKI